MLSIENLSKSFISKKGMHQVVLKNISISIDPGDFVSIVGGSGSGKSTILNIVAELVEPSKGQINWSNPLNKPRIGYVFQDTTIFPWKSVANNLAFVLERTGVTARKDLENTINNHLKEVGLEFDMHGTKLPKELSGGEKRRVAIAMALANNSDLFLLDEPTSSLDDINKTRFQHTLQAVLVDKTKSTILVTHDIEEAIFLGSRVIILGEGKILGEIFINEERPRPEAFRNSQRLIEIKSQVKQIIRKS